MLIKIVYLPKEPFWGLGDYLRGVFSVAELCSQTHMNWELEYSMHPICKHLINQHQTADTYTREDVYVFSMGEIQSIQSIFEQLQGIPDGVFYMTTCVWYLKHGVQAATRIRIRESMQAGPFLQAVLRETQQALDILEKPYRAIHVRMGDKYLLDHCEKQELFQTVQTTLHEMIAEHADDTSPIVVFSDSSLLKDYLRTTTAFHISNTNPCHLSTEDDDVAVFQTLLDFFLIAGASHIYQISAHGYGTGFSDWCSELFEVPISRRTIKTDVHWICNIEQ